MSKVSTNDVNTLTHVRNRRLREVFHILKDPLLQNLGKQTGDLEEFIKLNADASKPFDATSLLEQIDSVISESLYTNKSGKRKIPEEKPKQTKKLKFLPDIEDTVKQENEALLEKDVTSLDILSVPQHYPTSPHNLSSLAEMYYLTQTLPLIKLLPGAHKTLTTSSFELALLEGKIAVLYSRIEELKRQGKWSLRQPLKYQDPFTHLTKPVKSHWDNLLREGHWLATDFKEQAKFKRACCVSIAQAVLDYWTYGKEVTCIKRKEIEFLPEEVEAPMEVETEAAEEADQPEDEVAIKEEVEGEQPVEQTEGQPSEETEPKAEVSTPAPPPPPVKAESPDPTAIDVRMLLKKSSGDEEEVEEINKNITYIPPKVNDTTSMFKLHVDLDDIDKLDLSIIRNLPKFTAFDDEELPNLGSQPLKPDSCNAVPVSKLLYPFEDDDNFYKILVREKPEEKQPYSLPPYQKGLFGSQSHRKFNYLKPPKPPLIKNIEYRSPTIWLPQDDKCLIHYVAEFCFNWDLIAEHLLSTVASMKRYESNIERRTPWQCFERYIQLNEKFQFGDMKGPYAYQAQQWLEQAHRAQSTTKRRISPLGIGNDSIQRGHRRLRWASMFDAMRKCMRKRENQLAKINSKRSTDYSQQVNYKSDKIPTPAELSKLKHERDKSIQEAYLNQQATRNRMMAAVAQQQKSQKSSTPTSLGTQKQVSPTSNISRPNSQPQRQSPGVGSDIPTNANGQPYTPEQLQKLIQIQKQRRLLQNQQQQQQSQYRNNEAPGKGSPQSQNSPLNKPGSSPSMATANMQGNPMMGTRAPPVNKQGMQKTDQQVQPSGNGNKPRIQFAPAQVSAIINSIQQKNPNLSKEQVTKLAASYLANLQQQQQKMQQQRQQAQTSPNMTQPQMNRKQIQVANLTPQERNQLQMLKAAKNQQQLQQLQQQQMRQMNMNVNMNMNQMPSGQMGSSQMSPGQMSPGLPSSGQLSPQAINQQIRSNTGSPLLNNSVNLSKLDYEQRKRLLMQKQQLQQQQYRQRMGQSRPGSGSSK